jgi:hypothetical protein
MAFAIQMLNLDESGVKYVPRTMTRGQSLVYVGIFSKLRVRTPAQGLITKEVAGPHNKFVCQCGNEFCKGPPLSTAASVPWTWTAAAAAGVHDQHSSQDENDIPIVSSYYDPVRDAQPR